MILSPAKISYFICAMMLSWYLVLSFTIRKIYLHESWTWSIVLILIGFISLSLSVILLLEIIRQDKRKLLGYGFIMLLGVIPITFFIMSINSGTLPNSHYIGISCKILFSLALVQLSRKEQLSRKAPVIIACHLLGLAIINSIFSIFLLFVVSDYGYGSGMGRSFFNLFTINYYIFNILYPLGFIVWLVFYIKNRRPMRPLNELIESPPDSVKWSEVYEFDNWHVRHSLVDELFPGLLEIEEGTVKWNSQGETKTKDEVLAWVWAITPYNGHKILVRASSDLKEIIRKYKKQKI